MKERKKNVKPSSHQAKHQPSPLFNLSFWSPNYPCAGIQYQDTSTKLFRYSLTAHNDTYESIDQATYTKLLARFIYYNRHKPVPSEWGLRRTSGEHQRSKPSRRSKAGHQPSGPSRRVTVLSKPSRATQRRAASTCDTPGQVNKPRLRKWRRRKTWRKQWIYGNWHTNGS